MRLQFNLKPTIYFFIKTAQLISPLFSCKVINLNNNSHCLRVHGDQDDTTFVSSFIPATVAPERYCLRLCMCASVHICSFFIRIISAGCPRRQPKPEPSLSHIAPRESEIELAERLMNVTSTHRCMCICPKTRLAEKDRNLIWHYIHIIVLYSSLYGIWP